MSESQRRQKLSELPALRRLLAASGVALALVVGQGGAISAQDATPSPVATECVAPELPPGTPTPMLEGSPEAMPEMEGIEGTPPAVATPEAEAAEAGTPADEATTAEITAAVENYIACTNSGDPAKFVALETANYLMSNYGTTNPYDAIAQEEEGGGFTIELVAITNPVTYSDGRVGADVEAIANDHWYVKVAWKFAEEDGYWKLDEETFLTPEPEGDTAVVGVALGSPEDEYSITPNATSNLQSEVLIFHVTNGGAEAHEMIVLQLPEGADPAGLFDGSVGFDQVTFIGGVFGIPPGGSQDLALVNLEPGDYTLICFFPAPDGKSHAEHGMVTTFTVDPL
jgi:uncharacterized cupredoxin-like copper-binding protein